MVRPAGRKVSAGLIVVCQSTQALAFAGIALFLPLIREDIGLTFSQAGSLAVATTLTYALMQVPAGYLADRLGAKPLFLAGLLGTNALTLALAFLHSYELLLVNQALSGFFRSLVFAPGLVLITAQFPTQRRATAMGLYVAGGFSTNIFLNSLGPFLVDPLGWRALFVLFSLVALAFLVLYWLVGATGPTPESAATRPSARELAGLLRHKVLWLAGVVQFVRLALVQAVRFWLPSFIVLDKGFTLQAAGLVVAFSALVTAPSNVLGGYISDRLGRPLLVIATSLSVLAVTCVLLVTADSLPIIVAVVGLQAVFIQVYFGPLFEVPIRFIGSRSAGTLNGFSNFLANLGGLTFAYVLGAVRDHTGSFAVGFYSLAAMCIVALGAVAMLARLEPAAVEPEVTHET